MNRSTQISSMLRGIFLATVGLVWGFAQADGPDSAGLDVETIQEFGSLDRNRNSGLDRLEFAFSEVAQRAREFGGRDQVDEVFALMDGDQNGEIELLELTASQLNRNVRILDRNSARSYGELDRDRDGLIAMQEYLDSPKAKQALENGKDPDFVASLFQRIDLNQSGVIGPFEWIQALGVEKQLMDPDSAAIFALLDKNDDGSIGASEHAAIDPAEFMHEAISRFETIDLNGNREVGPQEFARAITTVAGPNVHPETMARFKEMDRNRDGAISRREFSRGKLVEMFARNREMEEEMFARIDTDGSDEIDLEEFANGRIRRKLDGPPPGKKPPGPPPKAR